MMNFNNAAEQIKKDAFNHAMESDPLEYNLKIEQWRDSFNLDCFGTTFRDDVDSDDRNVSISDAANVEVGEDQPKKTTNAKIYSRADIKFIINILEERHTLEEGTVAAKKRQFRWDHPSIYKLAEKFTVKSFVVDGDTKKSLMYTCPKVNKKSGI